MTHNPRPNPALRRFWTAVALVVIVIGSEWSASAQSESLEYYGTDAMSSVRVVYDGIGPLSARTDLTPFGTELSSASNMPAERFTGQARDSEAGLDYFNARMYDPSAGRFTQRDPVRGDARNPQTWNAYAYVANRPLNATDPSGMLTADTNLSSIGWRLLVPRFCLHPQPA